MSVGSWRPKVVHTRRLVRQSLQSIRADQSDTILAMCVPYQFTFSVSCYLERLQPFKRVPRSMSSL